MKKIEANSEPINKIKGRAALVKYPYYSNRSIIGWETTIGLIIGKWFYPHKYEDYLNGTKERKQISAHNLSTIYIFDEVTINQYNKAYNEISHMVYLLTEIDKTKKSYSKYQEAEPIITACEKIKENTLKKIHDELLK